MLAELAGTSEDQLLDKLVNVECSRCGVLYKQQWFPREVLARLFAERVPSHPKGWDVLSGRFTPDNFLREVDQYETALRAKNAGQINRFRRALASIIDSIPKLDGSAESRQLLDAVEEGNISELRQAETLLRRSMAEPTPYKRFSGFSASGLWHYLNDILGNINAYGEVGCPLWGLLPRAAEQGNQAIYFQRDEPNYWGQGCQVNGTHCSQRLLKQSNVEARQWSESLDTTLDLIGAFQYLDHLEQPAQFMCQLLDKAKAAAIILDAVEEPVYIQHFTGFTRKAIQWVADQHACKVHDNFNDIRQSGNQLFLLERT